MFSPHGCQKEVVVLNWVGKVLDTWVHSCGHGYSQIMFNLNTIPIWKHCASIILWSRAASAGVVSLLNEVIRKWLPTEHRKQFSIGDTGSSTQSHFVITTCSSSLSLDTLLLHSNMPWRRGKPVEWLAEVSFSSVNSGLKHILKKLSPTKTQVSFFKDFF